MMFVCQNQPCGARWAPDEVEIHNEGQGPIFRCPMCGARNYLKASQGRDGAITYKQVSREQAVASKPETDKGQGAPRQRRRG
jgi:hypothetical protein